EIGAGGFGRVFRARDLGLEREVAIKVLHPSLTADLGVVERFRREAQLAAKLRHPNVVSIYDIMGRAGLQWYTMELVPGANLAQLGRPPFEGATPEAILARQTTDDLPPLHASRGDVPREFEEVLRRAMTGDPAARYPSAQQFRQAVRKSQGFLRRLVVFLRGD